MQIGRVYTAPIKCKEDPPMKKLISGLLAALLVLAMAGAALSETRLDQIKAAGKLVVATSPDYAPYEFPGPDGKTIGADIKLAQYLADKLGVELVIDEYDFDGVLAAIGSGKVDLAIAGIDPTEERKGSMDFSDSYYNENNQSLVVHKDNAGQYNTLKAMAGKLVAAQNGTVQESMVTKFLPESTLELVAKVPDGVMMVLSKKVDGMALANVVAEQYVANYPELVICEEKFDYTSDGIAVAVVKGQPELLAAINEAIAEVVDQKLFFDWMAEAVEINNSMNN